MGNTSRGKYIFFINYNFFCFLLSVLRFFLLELGVFDVVGTVAEWIRADMGTYEVRGGSWRDVPRRSTASFRSAYQPYQHVYNVGFRVVCESPPTAVVKVAAARSR